MLVHLQRTPRCVSSAARSSYVRCATHARRRRRPLRSTRTCWTTRPSTGAKRVCLACFARGFTPQDVDSYRCMECTEKGHAKFDRMSVNNAKRRGLLQRLVCVECTARHRAIEDTLRDKKALRCTCKGKAKDRVHSFSNEKCDLYPKYAGDQRWPGSNLNISEEDWHLCKRMRRHREGNKH